MVDLLIVLGFVAYSVGIGLVSRKRASTDLTEYFLAGRRIPGWQAGSSMAATQFAADTPLLATGLLAAGGAFSLWRLWIYGLAFLLMGFILASAWRRSGVLTDAELTMVRYSARGALALRGLKAVYYGTVINCVVMAFVLVAAVRIFEIFLPWHVWLPNEVFAALHSLVLATGLEISSGVTGLAADVATVNNVISIVLMLGFVGLYSTTGGLRSVVATDVVQLCLMLAGTAAYAWIATADAGGLGRLPEQLAELYGEQESRRMLSLAPIGEEALLPFLTIVGLQWFFQMNSDGTGYLAQRTMACSDHRQARVAAVVFTMLQIVVRSLLWLVIGLALLVIYPFDAGGTLTEAQVANRELTFAIGMDELLPAGVRGLMLTAMLAALASTLDTHLNWGAGYWSNDLYKGIWVEHVRKRQAGPRELVLVARLSNLLILAIALVIMVNLDSIRTAWQISLLFGAGVGAVLVLRWVWERINLWCEILSIAVSLVAAPLLILLLDQDWLRLLCMSGISLCAVILAAYCLPPTDQARLVAFYRRVRPPGLWARTIAAAGRDPAEGRQDMLTGLAGLAACAVSVYGWLVGFAGMLVQNGSLLFNAALITAGFAAVPVWLRILRLEDTSPVQ